jgi:hypothetical protein
MVLMGGTSLRKCRIGHDGRFSTDLDFAAPGDETVLDVCAAVDGARVGGFGYRLEATRGDGRHWALSASHQHFGAPAIAASIELARRPLVLPPQRLGFVALPVHKRYGFDLPALPVIAEAEACAEKLARYRRSSFARDLYDLTYFAGRPLDPPLVRRLWALKVWGDAVDDGRGGKALRPATCSACAGRPSSCPTPWASWPTRSVCLTEWEERVRRRFGFLAELDEEEQRWAACDERHRAEVRAAVQALRQSPN